MRPLTIMLLAALLAGSASPAAAQRRFALEGASLINGYSPNALADRVIVVDGGRITGVGRKNQVIIPSGTQRIDVTGKFIVPGLIDAHVHEESPGDWARHLAWGVTSVNCMFENSDTALAREAWSRSDTLAAPRIHATATIFTARGGWWEGEGFPDDPEVNRFPATPAEAREAVRALHAKGITRIKVMLDDMGWCRDPLPRLTKMDPAVLEALLDEARRLRLAAQVHAPTIGDARAAVDAGAGALVHGIVDARVDAPLVESVLSNEVFYMPTFCLYRFLAGTGPFIASALADSGFRRSLTDSTAAALSSAAYAERYLGRYPNAAYVESRIPVLEQNASGLANNYAQVVLGTDMWALPGIGAHLELEYMVHAGLTPMQALTAATFLPAKFLRVLNKTGTIEPGKDADLLVLDANPLEDIRNTRSISMIVKQGRIFRPAELLDRAKTGGGTPGK